MKKTLSIILAAVLVCLSITVYAEDGDKSGTTKISTSVAHVPTYTFHIPAETSVDASKSEAQSFGLVYVKDLKYMEDKHVVCTPSGENFKLVGSAADTMAATYTYKTKDMSQSAPFAKFTCGEGEANAAEVFVQIAKDAFEAAKNGEYTATVTFNFVVE